MSHAARPRRPSTDPVTGMSMCIADAGRKTAGIRDLGTQAPVMPMRRRC
jgi:hypothetical protein